MQQRGPILISRMIIGAVVGGIIGVIAYLVFAGSLIGFLALLFGSSVATTPAVSEWRVRAAAPAADPIEVEWKCEFHTGNETKVRDGKVVPDSTGTTVVRDQAERVSCSLWKRSPGQLVAVLYRGDTIAQRVESTANTDLIVLAGSSH